MISTDTLTLGWDGVMEWSEINTSLNRDILLIHLHIHNFDMLDLNLLRN